MASAWLRVNRLIAVVFVPALLGLAVVSSDFVTVVLGRKWESATPLLQILALGIIAQAVSALGLEVLKALGRVNTLFRFTVLETIAFLVGIVAGLPWGAVGVAAAYTLVNIPSRAYFLWLTTDALGVPFGRFLGTLSGVAQASLAMLACTLAVRTLLASVSMAPWLRLTLVIAVGVAVYVPMCVWRVPAVRAELGRLRQDALGRRDALALATAADRSLSWRMLCCR
jgi:O-antigen/teichoic acid export membrane protein